MIGIESKDLWRHLSKRRQKQFWLLLILMVMASIVEVISIGLILPFLGVITAPEQVFQYEIMQPVIDFLGVVRPDQLVLPLTISFVVAVLFAGVIRLTMLYVLIRLSFATGADISINIYRRTLYQDYSVHVGRNSSEIINSIIAKIDTVIVGTIIPTLVLISSTILIVGIVLALLFINTAVSLGLFISFGALYWGVSRYTRVMLEENSQNIADKSTQMIKALQEGLGGIRDIILDGSQDFFCRYYSNADSLYRRASGSNQFISASPRYAIEAMGMVFIAVFAYVLTQQDGGPMETVPILGALALGAQRLLPVLQQAYASYSNIRGSKSSLVDVLSLLNQPLSHHSSDLLLDSKEFKKDIKLKNLGFRYTKDTPWILKGVNLKITKGERIGFIGLTGSGKSTLLDIIMGLLPPTEGQLSIDDLLIEDENIGVLRANIAHVPQDIYLSDGTVEENIAFGVSKELVNHQQVEKAAKQAKISELIESWTDGYQTLVGERGLKISGGQRQRIGIARAIYKNASILIFDEATSALDSETELKIIETIENLDRKLTVLIIAHRYSTLRSCNRIIKLDNVGKISIGSYQEMANEKK
jgi:ATP-binding cassette, subfamily B, bacterial PglK